MTSQHEPRLDPWLAAPPAPPERHGLATASLLLGVGGFICFPVITGVIAIFCGLSARQDISRSEGRKVGKGMALAGMLAGASQLVAAGLVFALWFSTADGRASSVAKSPHGTSVPAMPPAVLPPGPTASGTPGAGTQPPSAVDRSLDEGILETRVGSVLLIDIGADAVPLESELERQRKLADKAGQKLVLWTVVPACKPCLGVAAALPDPKLQRALGNARLVRVNVRDHLLELERLRIPTDKIPGFALLGTTNRPLDYVNGGEWDADIAENIAPVLEKFIRGEYAKRREPWRGGRRDDETPI